MVGFEERSVISLEDKSLVYAFHRHNLSSNTSFGSWVDHYSIMLMTGCFVHKAYLELYFDPDMIPNSILDYVNAEMNCEDILLSVVVTKFLQDIGHSQSGVVTVEERKKIKHLDFDKCRLGCVGGSFIYLIIHLFIQIACDLTINLQKSHQKCI